VSQSASGVLINEGTRQVAVFKVDTPYRAGVQADVFTYNSAGALKTFRCHTIFLHAYVYVDYPTRNFSDTYSQIVGLRSRSPIGNGLGDLGEETAILLGVYEFLNPSDLEFPTLLDESHGIDGFVGERDTVDRGAYIRGLCRSCRLWSKRCSFV
jgi:hypothetical protein